MRDVLGSQAAVKIRYKDPDGVVHVNATRDGHLRIALCERRANVDYWSHEQLEKTRKMPTCVTCLAFWVSE